ncbi:hypothetical protein SAMN04487884_1501 [Butyrivibrio fibrisolvens]|uniref:Uncharacterized protein n=1 Tax=Butyrivibrio fibrisolvens TaxID=831 RepID=A0A1H9XA23_BUTFI|nr:hypothetical protein SAMN04487884_1501 [Butyrivibrio fibrisolvens]
MFEYDRDRKEIIGYLSEHGSKYKRFTTSGDAKDFIRMEYEKREL